MAQKKEPAPSKVDEKNAKAKKPLNDEKEVKALIE